MWVELLTDIKSVHKKELLAGVVSAHMGRVVGRCGVSTCGWSCWQISSQYTKRSCWQVLCQHIWVELLAGVESVHKKKVADYHWQELPQVSFLSWQKFCHDKHMFVMTKHIFCRDKSMLVVTKLLLRFNILSLQNFVMTNIILLWQMFCHDKQTFVMTKDVFCHDKHVFVATKVFLLWKNFCHDKIMFVVTIIYCNKSFVMTNTWRRKKQARLKK